MDFSASQRNSLESIEQHLFCKFGSTLSVSTQFDGAFVTLIDGLYTIVILTSSILNCRAIACLLSFLFVSKKDRKQTKNSSQIFKL